MSMRILRVVPFIAAATLAFAIPATAQVAAEIRGGGVIGNHVPTAAGLQKVWGPAVSGSIQVRATPWLSMYGSYLSASFPCRGGFCGDGSRDNATISASGFGGGVRLNPGTVTWLRVGALYYGTSVDAGAGPDRTDPSLGFEMAGGFTIHAFGPASLVPGVYLRTQPGDSRTTMMGGDLGIHVSLGRR
jgi:hypothetical protein